jgi:polysaccharide export outer membrane protein
MKVSGFSPSRFASPFRKTVRLSAVLFLIFIILPLSAVQAQQAQSEKDAGIYEFGAGDVLNIYVYEEPEISQTVTVRSDGRISLPLVGDVSAAGQTPEGLAGKIADKLERFIDAPNVTVTLAESRPKVYYILGQVESPGEYDINRPVTVIQALSRAGGFLEWAKKSRIMIVSGHDQSEKIDFFDYDEFLDHPAEEKNVVLKPGDTIVVP